MTPPLWALLLQNNTLPLPVPSGKFSYGPTPYMLMNRVDLYLRVPTKDADRGTVPAYQIMASSVPCTVQPHDVRSRYDQNEAIIQFIPYEVYFNLDPGLPQYSLIQWLDDLSVVHKILVRGTRNEAGRGGSFVIDGEERV